MNDSPSQSRARMRAPSPSSRPPCLLGLIGSGIQESKSPLIHESEAAAQGLQCSYELIDLDARGLGAEALPELLREVELRGFAGVNITYPCKQAIIPLLHELSEEARAIGAVNTVHLSKGRRIGYNTDAWGFAESFERDLPGAPLDRVVQVGAGGAGAATAYALLRRGVRELTIFDNDSGRAVSLMSNLSGRFPERDIRATLDLQEALRNAQGVVNASPVGMAKHPGSAVPLASLRPDLWVADIVYFPLETQLLRAARAAGCRTLDGGGMAVSQAARAFEIFTGLKADGDRMRRHFEQIDHG
jgi:shikimate dehydrogenase